MQCRSASDATSQSIAVVFDEGVAVGADSSLGAADVSWRFSSLALALLAGLNDSFGEAASGVKKTATTALPGRRRRIVTAPAGIIGMQEKANVKLMLQFLIAFGVHPYLLPGVGLPVEKRVSAAALEIIPKKTARGSKRLLYAVTIMRSCLGRGDLSDVIYETALLDLIAAMAQLAYGPVLFDSSSTAKQPGAAAVLPQLLTTPADPRAAADTLCATISSAASSLDPDSRLEMANSLHEFTLDLTCKSALDASFALIGSARSPAPEWLRAYCSRMQVNTIMRDGGVAALFTMILTPALGNPEHQWLHVDRLSKMLSSLPPTAHVTIEAFLAATAPQCKCHCLLIMTGETHVLVYWPQCASCCTPL